MAKRTTRAVVDRAQAEHYAAVADQFHRAAQLARDHDYWNAAGVLYVHAAIAFADAVAIRRRGEKSTSDNHLDALALLEESSIGLRGRDEARRHLRRIIDEKNRVAYTGESFRRADLGQLATHADRFRAFAERVLQG